MSDIDINLEESCYNCYGQGHIGYTACETCGGHGELLTSFGSAVMEMVRRRLSLADEPNKGEDGIRRLKESNERYEREKAERDTPEYKAEMERNSHLLRDQMYSRDSHTSGAAGTLYAVPGSGSEVLAASYWGKPFTT
ncbi:hypothetical protein [Methylobacterium sp. CM6244]